VVSTEFIFLIYSKAMGWNNIQVKVGLIIIASFSIFAFLLFNSANWPWTSKGEVIPIYFDSISELKVGASVQISGVQVGKVTDIELLGNKVRVKTRIKDAFSILKKGCKVNIEMVGLVGETFVNIKNTPPFNPNLEPSDLPLFGSSLTSVMGIMEQADKALMNVSQAAGVMEAIDKDEIKKIISSLMKLIDETNVQTNQTLSNLNELIAHLDEAVVKYQNELDKSINELNNVVAQTHKDVQPIIESLDSFSKKLNKLIDSNSVQIEKTITNFEQISGVLNIESEKVFQDLTDLNSEVSKLVISTQSLIDKDADKIDQLIENLNLSAQNFDNLSHRLDKILENIEKGNGTISQLINKPESIKKLNSTLESADYAIKEFTQVSDKISQKVDYIQKPNIQWDYKLNYNSLSETLYNEIAFSIERTKNQRYRIGLSSAGKDTEYEFQYEHLFGNLTGRVGFIRSKPSIGLDYWLLSKRLGLSLEGIGITEKDYSIDFETKLGFMKNCFIIIGAQNITDDIGYIGGIHLKY